MSTKVAVQEAADDCAWWDALCAVQQQGRGLARGAGETMLQTWWQGANEWLASIIVDWSTFWIESDTPSLLGGGRVRGPAEPATPGGGLAPEEVTSVGGAEGQMQMVETVMGYAQWIGLGICVLSLMVAGARFGRAWRSDVENESEDASKIGTVLMATILISGASALVGALFGTGRVSSASAPVAFIQDRVWWYAMALAVVGVIVAGVKMAWEQRADPGRDLVRALITMIVVVAAAVPALGMLVAAADEFSMWIMREATGCRAGAGEAACFERRFTEELTGWSDAGWDEEDGNVTAAAGHLGLYLGGLILAVILGVVGVIQMVLMLARSGILVVLTGLLPVAAAATNTEMGQSWFKQAMGWLVGWLLYKPTAAIIYATAFYLPGAGADEADSPTIAMLSGGILMVLAVVALPAIMRSVSPWVAGLESDGSGRAGGLAQSVATGAVMLGGKSLVARGGARAAAAPPSGGGPSGADSAGGQGSGHSGGSGQGDGRERGSGGGQGTGGNGGQGSGGGHGAGADGSSGAGGQSGGALSAAAAHAARDRAADLDAGAGRALRDGAVDLGSRQNGGGSTPPGSRESRR